MIAVENLSMSYGSFALRDVRFEVPDGKYGVLMGKTGSGKTTILEAVIGLRKMDTGTVRLSGRDVTALKPAERGIGYVPQDGALFSTLSVREHLAFALKVRRWSRQAIAERVGELARMLGISHILKRKPHGLSGGESQRVALGRALAAHPRILCLDEPLSALDEDTRREMCSLLESVRERTGVTSLHVTHSQQEARRLADVVLFLEDGVIRPGSVEDLPDDGMNGRGNSPSPSSSPSSASRLAAPDSSVSGSPATGAS